MRIAFIGLSTPVFFDYGTPASRTRADVQSSPNPILDSPFGLMLLYDELWFLCRSLCPENMRGLDFVRFVDEEGMLPEIDDLDPWALAKERAPEIDEMYERRAGFIGMPDPRALRIDWDAKADNHTHSLRIGPLTVSANAGDPRLILFDLEVVRRLARSGVELVGNTWSQGLLDVRNTAPPEALVHALTIDRIPNYQMRLGPYHPVIAEARSDRFLVDFRRWASDLSPETPTGQLGELKVRVERGLEEAQAQLFLAHLDPRATYYSIGKTVLTSLADAVVPLVGAGSQVYADLRHDRRVRDDRWQGFLVSLDQIARASSS